MKAKKVLLFIGIFFLIVSSLDAQIKKRVVVKNPRKAINHYKIPSSKVVYKKNMVQIKGMRVLPEGSLMIRYKGLQFHYHGGVFYRYYGKRYILVNPPLGIKIRLLPKNHITFVLDKYAYYYCNGIFYKKIRNGNYYEVIDAPIGAIINELPHTAELIKIDGKNFYECNLTVYKKIRDSHGFSYQVVGRIESHRGHF